MAKPLERVQACVFDAYGTLFDYVSAAARCREQLGNKFERLSALWRERQLQYTWLRTIEQAHVDFWEVTGQALDFAMETLKLRDPVLRDRLMTLYLELDMFPEVRETLTRLRSSGLKTAILSNGSPGMLKALVERNAIGDLMDEVLSVEEVGVYKPHPKVYALATARLGLQASEIVFLSANAWDAYAASAFGLRVIWCNRYGQHREHLPGNPDHEVKTLLEVPDLLGRLH